MNRNLELGRGPHVMPDRNCDHSECVRPLCGGLHHRNVDGHGWSEDARITRRWTT